MKVEIFKNKGKRFPIEKFKGFQKDKQFYYAYMPKRQANACVKKAMKMGYKARCFDEKYERSPKYRYNFIKNNPPVNGYYRCAYCGHKVRKDDMEVDHILPVSKAKEYEWVRKKLKHGVNDLSNLVPSCHRCNMRKLDSVAFRWRMKAKLGRHQEYWGVRKIILLIIVIIAIAILSGQDFSAIDEAVRSKLELLK